MKNKGFTLIEIMIIIAIIGIIAAIAIPQFKKYNNKRNGIVEQEDKTPTDAVQKDRKTTKSMSYEKHCVEGYIFITTNLSYGNHSKTINQLIDASGNGVLCDDYK